MEPMRWRRSSRQRPRLVLLDMRMPVLDGWGFASALRERGLALPVVVMTAAADASRWADEIGAIGVVAKPFGVAELVNAVRRYSGAAPGTRPTGECERPAPKGPASAWMSGAD